MSCFRFCPSSPSERALDAGQHLYYASQGLAGAELVYEGMIANAHDMNWDYDGEYVKIMWSDNPDFPELDMDK